MNRAVGWLESGGGSGGTKASRVGYSRRVYPLSYLCRARYT